ncbi:MAG TPA: ABC transporter ATP-binding protein/permease [Geminicoccaceae bacterium]|nr:ABC transporter ATP-binding protein/permease [Geminicoccaceae bacterium]
MSRRLAATHGFLAKLWKLTAPYFWSEERWSARGLLAIVVGSSVVLVYILKLLNDWNARFFNALQDKDIHAFWAELQYFCVLAFMYILIAVYRLWFRQLLQIRWRRWLTGVYVRDWLADRTYYRMELTSAQADNPEQRIEEDCRTFTDQTLFLVLDLLSQILTLATFTTVLWGLSGSITLPVLGGLTIPGYMMWVAVVYAALGSWLTYKIGRPLVRVNFDLQRFNADFRYRMVRVRENAESIALYEGEPDEQRRLAGAFGRIFGTWWDYMRYTKRITWFSNFYGQAAAVFPFVVASPRYFMGQIPLGVLTQTAGAFAQVQGSLSWLVDSWSALAEWRATIDRLTTFGDSMEAARRVTQETSGFTIERIEGGPLRLEGVEVALPNGRILLEHVDLEVRPGDRLVIQGPSGSGKTTLFRVLAGLWPFGRGLIELPKSERLLFLPQKPYLPVGTLREALCFPESPDAYDLVAVGEALALTGLEHLADRLDEERFWSPVLSPGEQQRLAVARALLLRPDWLFLDEATSALDEAMEARLYRLLQERLPRTAIISVAHNQSVVAFHDRRLTIDPGARRLMAEPVALAG